MVAATHAFRSFLWFIQQPKFAWVDALVCGLLCPLTMMLISSEPLLSSPRHGDDSQHAVQYSDGFHYVVERAFYGAVFLLGLALLLMAMTRYYALWAQIIYGIAAVLTAFLIFNHVRDEDRARR